MPTNACELLSRLVQIPSVNPSFAGGSADGEAQLTDFLQDLLEELGCRWLRQTVHPGRDNLITVFPGSGPGVWLWEVHQDTVGVEGMAIDPFAGNLQDGRLWGRGACDVKGGMAAMLTALSRAQAESDRSGPPIVLAMTINEECGFTGVSALCRIWAADEQQLVDPQDVRGPLSLAELRDLKPQQAIVAEPTQLDLVVAHKGVVRWRCHARGRSAHSSQPELGNNAIYAIARVARAIDRYHREELASRQPHALCGRPTACVSTVQGGTGVNIVPDHAVIDIDRRLLPAEAPQQAVEDLCAYLDRHALSDGTTIENESPWIVCPGLEDDHNREWANQIATVARATGIDAQLTGVPYGTDASTIATHGIPAVVFGPGSIDQAHTQDEWLDIEQLSQATEILYRLATSGDLSR